jgi:tetratricopeptide (TPR) repeat protein
MEKTMEEMKKTIQDKLHNKKFFYPIYRENTLKKIYDLFETEPDEHSLNIDLRCFDSTYYLYCGIYYNIHENMDLAKHWYKQATEQGNTNAMVELGVCLYKENDKEQAKLWLKKSSDSGNRHGMHQYGIALNNEDKFEEAKFWLIKSLELGTINALKCLAITLYNQDDMEQFLFWFDTACLMGNENTIWYFMKCLFDDTHVFLRKLYDDDNHEKMRTIVLYDSFQKTFPKFHHFYSGREKFLTQGECGVCYNQSSLIVFDCFHHSYCVLCYMMTKRCPQCFIEKNKCFENKVLFELSSK